MANSLPSPPRTREPSPQDIHPYAATEDLAQRLDDLLAQYLEVLDEYTSLRKELGKTFSNGFLSLAHAQRTSNLGPGRRYGQDGYDSRMKASRHVKFGTHDCMKISEAYRAAENKATQTVDVTAQHTGHKVEILSRVNKPDAPVILPEKQDNVLGKIQSSVDGELYASADKVLEQSFSDNTGKEFGEPKVDPAYRDPVMWYGILVPPPLRQAQKYFSSSIEGTIPKLLSATSLLRSLESQIWVLRTKLGLREQYSEAGTAQVSIRTAAIHSAVQSSTLV